MNKRSLWITGLLWMFLVCLGACSDDDEGQETLLPCPEVNTLEAVPGNGTVTLNWTTDKEDYLSHFVVSYHLMTDTVTESVSVEGKLKTVKIEGLLQKEYAFSIVAVNTQGTRSAEKEVKATPDEPVQNQLIETVQIGLEKDKVKVSWDVSLSRNMRLNIVTTRKNGIQRRTYNLKDYPEGEVSFTLPAGRAEVKVTCLDSYENASAAVTRNCEVSGVVEKSSWSILDFSSQQNTGSDAAKNIIDGNSNDYNGWQSRWDPNETVPPQYVTVDLGQEINIMELNLWRRIGGNWDTKSVDIYLSLDGTNFGEKVATLDYVAKSQGSGNREKDHSKTVIFEEAVKARYVKCVVTASYRKVCSLCELNIIGFPEEE